MKKYSGWASAISFVLLSIPGTAMALERWLVPDVSQCAANTTVNPCHLTLQDAVTQATANDSIRILPGTYPANVTLTNKNITIFGEETARTFLTGNGGTTIIVSGVTSPMDIRDITFINASPAILVNNNSSSVNIKNNIFEVASNSTAIQASDTSNPLIMNNTFFQNGTAIQSALTTLNIVNNIFSSNALAISANVVSTNILSNIFWQNSSIGPAGIIFDQPGTVGYQFNDLNSQDPQFVIDPATVSNIPDRDFHLKGTTTSTNVQGNAQAGTNSINAVSPPDLGAYGGSSSDTIPLMVSNLTGTALSDTSAGLTWPLNNCYMVTGYNVYYNINQAGPPYTNAVDAHNVTTFPFTLDVSSILASAPTLTAPANLTAEPIATGTLSVSWSPVSGATGYEISYKKATDSTFTTSPVTGPPVTLSGLEDSSAGGVPIFYDISVRAFYQASVHAAVKSYYAPSSPSPPTPNPKEALAFSNDALISFGTPTFGPSSSIQAFAESIVANPDLPNKGCFIATAAYGYYSAPQVRALREFRDRYLMTYGAGRAFVGWYYRYGPAGAEFINAHAWLKPVVRTALMPAVVGALFMTRTSLLTKAAVLIMAGILAGYLMRGRKHVHSGGAR